MKNTIKISLISFSFLMNLLSSCNPHDPTKPSEALSVEMSNSSMQVSMNILPDQMGKFEAQGRFFGVIPRKLNTGSQTHEIELYVVDSPAFGWDEFTIENINQAKLKLAPPKRLSSPAQLAGELKGAGLGFDNIVVAARRVDTSITKGQLTVKDLDAKTSVSCTCPCSVEFDNDGVKYSCK